MHFFGYVGRHADGLAWHFRRKPRDDRQPTPLLASSCGDRVRAGRGVCSTAIAADADADDGGLTQTITALDAKVFDACNRCDLDSFGRCFAPGVEFYHDKGGVTHDRATVIANTRKYICHEVRRELIAGTLKVYPGKDYGAIEEGDHRFCPIDGGTCEGVARFLNDLAARRGPRAHDPHGQLRASTAAAGSARQHNCPGGNRCPLNMTREPGRSTWPPARSATRGQPAHKKTRRGESAGFGESV